MSITTYDPEKARTVLSKYLAGAVLEAWWSGGILAPEDMNRAFYAAAEDFIHGKIGADDFILVCTYLYWQGFVRYTTLRPPGLEPDAIEALEKFSDLPYPERIDPEAQIFLKEVVTKKSHIGSSSKHSN